MSSLRLLSLPAFLLVLGLTACNKSTDTPSPASTQNVVSTIAGSMAGFAEGTGAAAQFDMPVAVAVDAQGVLYVSDYNNNRIRRITPAGVVSTLAGSGTMGFADGPGNTAQFNGPSGLALDAQGTLYVADVGNNRIRKISSAGTVTTLAGSGAAGFADGMGSAATFNAPNSVPVDAQGNVYVADTENHRIRKVAAQ